MDRKNTGPRWSGLVPTISGSVLDRLRFTVACFWCKKPNWTGLAHTTDKDNPTQPPQEGLLFPNDSEESSSMLKGTTLDESLRRNYKTTIEEILDENNPTQPPQEGPLFPSNSEESSPMLKSAPLDKSFLLPKDPPTDQTTPYTNGYAVGPWYWHQNYRSSTLH